MTKFLFPVIGFLAIIFSLLFIWQNQSVVAQTYDFEDLQQKLVDLRQENNSLQLNAAKTALSSSLPPTEAQFKELGLEKTGRVNFIKLVDSEVVVKQ
jgi:hypothetical protein